jgi:hypothetical protein
MRRLVLEFEVTRTLPPPIGQLADDERTWVIDALVPLRSGDAGPLERALQEILEQRISQAEFSDYLLFAVEDQQAVLQRLIEQVPQLSGVRLAPAWK